MTERAQIIGLNRVAKPKANKGGSIILAFFDCTFSGVMLRGCALVRTKSGGLVAWPPHFLDEPGRKSIRITDDSLRHEMMMQAREAYRALGGTDAETIGKSVPMRPVAVS